jgi:hypothetical protein
MPKKGAPTSYTLRMETLSSWFESLPSQIAKKAAAAKRAASRKKKK